MSALQQQQQQRNWIGAGVIPFAIDEKTKEIYVLLGKENNAPNWKMRSNKWCDFSGGRDPFDIDVEMTAAREYFEETSAVPCLWPDQQCTQFYESLKDGSGYLYKLDRISPGTTQYPTFLCKIQFMSHLPKQFDGHRNRLLELKRRIKVYDSLISSPPETLQLTTGGSILELVFLQETGSIQFTIVFNSADAGLDAEMTDDCQTIKASDDCQTIKTANVIWSASTDAEVQWARDICAAHRSWVDYYQKMFGPNVSAAAAISRSQVGSHTTSVSVIDCFIEKQRIEWYSIEWLRDMITNGGTFGTESFRSSFIPMLSVLLDIFCSRVPKMLKSNAAESKKSNELKESRETQYIVDVRLWSMSTSLRAASNVSAAAAVDVNN